MFKSEIKEKNLERINYGLKSGGKALEKSMKKREEVTYSSIQSLPQFWG